MQESAECRRKRPRPFLNAPPGMFYGAWFIAVVVGAAVYTPVTGRHSGTGLVCGIAAVPAVLGVADAVRSLRRATALRRLLQRHNYLLCPYCHYPLSASRDRGRCSECGVEYRREEVLAKRTKAPTPPSDG